MSKNSVQTVVLLHSDFATNLVIAANLFYKIEIHSQTISQLISGQYRKQLADYFGTEIKIIAIFLVFVRNFNTGSKQ